MTTSRLDLQEKVIPKKIHFIWVGGSIPENYLKNIEKLGEIAKRDGFELNVWVDNKENILKTQNKMHFTKSEERTKKVSIVDYDLPNPNFRIRQIDELIDRMETDNFYKKNKEAKKDFTKFLRSEMVGLKNLGAAADILRYEILRQEGGTYLDADTKLFLEDKTKLKQESSLFGFRANMRVHREGMKKNGGAISVSDNEPLSDEQNEPLSDEQYQILREIALELFGSPRQKEPESLKNKGAKNEGDHSMAGVNPSRVWIDPTGENTPEILINEGVENGAVSFSGGNDIISSIPDHPILQSLILDMLNSYKSMEKSPPSSREKTYMGLTKQPQHQLPTTQLDSKRFPLIGKDITQDPRLAYTLSATGPALLQAVMGKYFKEQPNHSLDALFSLQLESRFLGTSPIEKIKQKQMGIDVQTRSDKNWLTKTKKIPSFTTERTSDTLFAQSSRKKLKKETVKKLPSESPIKKKI